MNIWILYYSSLFLHVSILYRFIFVTTRPNMLYIVQFGSYSPHDFVPGDASPLLSLTPQNTYSSVVGPTPIVYCPLWVPPIPRLLTLIVLNAYSRVAQRPKFVVYCPLWVPPTTRLPTLMILNAYNMLATSTTNKASYQTITRWCGILQSTPFKEPDDPIDTTGQPVRSALIPNVTTRPNMLYIVHFGSYNPHDFVSGDASPLLSLTPQNTHSSVVGPTPAVYCSLWVPPILGLLTLTVLNAYSRVARGLNLSYTVRFGSLTQPGCRPSWF